MEEKHQPIRYYLATLRNHTTHTTLQHQVTEGVLKIESKQELHRLNTNKRAAFELHLSFCVFVCVCVWRN